MEEVKIETDYIKLDQFLKYIGEAESGFHAKLIIKDEEVLVNGQIETRRGRKLRSGDVVELEGNEYLIK